VTVFLHVGCSKTGTTSIQHAMADNAGRLRDEYAINYPGNVRNHWSIALPFLDGERYIPMENHALRENLTNERALQRARNILADVGGNAARYRTQVLSAEQLAHLGAETLRGMKSFFDRLGLPVKIIVYVRHPAERISSLISQKIRAGRWNLATFAIVDGVTSTLRTYADVFGRENMIVRRFGSQYFTNGDLLDDFTSNFNGTPIPGMGGARLRESLSLPALLIADRLFEIAPLTSRARGKEKYLDVIAGPKFLAPRALVEKAIEVHRPCLEFLEAEYGITFDDVDLSRFPETISHEFSGETLASLAAILNDQAVTIEKLTVEVERMRKFLTMTKESAAVGGAYAPGATRQ
jgi:hypothetical protein